MKRMLSAHHLEDDAAWALFLRVLVVGFALAVAFVAILTLALGLDLDAALLALCAMCVFVVVAVAIAQRRYSGPAVGTAGIECTPGEAFQIVRLAAIGLCGGRGISEQGGKLIVELPLSVRSPGETITAEVRRLEDDTSSIRVESATVQPGGFDIGKNRENVSVLLKATVEVAKERGITAWSEPETSAVDTERSGGQRTAKRLGAVNGRAAVIAIGALVAVGVENSLLTGWLALVATLGTGACGIGLVNWLARDA